MLDPEKEINLQDEVEFTVVEVWTAWCWIDILYILLLSRVFVKKQIAIID